MEIDISSSKPLQLFIYLFLFEIVVLSIKINYFSKLTQRIKNSSFFQLSLYSQGTTPRPVKEIYVEEDFEVLQSHILALY